MKTKIHFLKMLKKIFLSIFLLSIPVFMATSQDQSGMIYPDCYDTKPETASPLTMEDGTETILVITKDGKYGIVPVTVENGDPLFYSYKLGTFMGKDRQLDVAAPDFPELAKTGLHSEEQLDIKERITGIPVQTINCTALPDAYSYAGFLAADEDIISVLKGDNQLVRAMGLKHADLAKPLFHVWNLLLKEMELGHWGRFYDHIRSIYYNGNILELSASGSKGWQISIFFDEIQGRYDIHLVRSLTPDEEEFLKVNYEHLTADEMSTLKNKLTHFHFSEMLPYYIMRYGFYEGHTEYRSDPLAIAFIFGLRSLEEIDRLEGGDLLHILTRHYSGKYGN